MYIYVSCLSGLFPVTCMTVCVFLNRVIMTCPIIITQIYCKILISKNVPKKRAQKLLCIFFCIPFRLYTLAHYRLHVAFLHTFSNIVAIWVKVGRLGCSSCISPTEQWLFVCLFVFAAKCFGWLALSWAGQALRPYRESWHLSVSLFCYTRSQALEIQGGGHCFYFYLPFHIWVQLHK